jgi:hypothetical protein
MTTPKNQECSPQGYNGETPAQLLNLLISCLPYRRTEEKLRRYKHVLKFVKAHLERSFDVHKTAYTEASRAAIRANLQFLDRQWSEPNVTKKK